MQVQTPVYAPKRFDPVEQGQVKRRGRLFLFCGVILPSLALLFESTIHFCAHHYFDPFPSAAHTVLFALIPLSNFLVWLGTRKDLSNHFAFMSLASGMATGVSFLYALMFLPLTAISCFFTLALGFGLLGLAPLISIPCNLIAGKTVCHMAHRKNTYFNAHQFEHMGHMIILVMVIAIELPSTLTRINIARASESRPAESAPAIDWLRHYGSQEVMLRSCYERSGRATDILGSLYESTHKTDVATNRKIFFKVTGKPYNAVPIPNSARATIQHANVIADSADLNAGVDDEFDIDTDIAGEQVSGMARGLSMKKSTITGSVDRATALASLTWTFSFNNDSKFDKEARAKILLPPDAVATKAVIIVNGIRREATIMVRDAARALYQQAAHARKDPLLVSTCGSDQLLVQCYPIKPGETVELELDIAAPLTIKRDNHASLSLPVFLERNFEANQKTTLDIDTETKVATTLEPAQLANFPAIDTTLEIPTNDPANNAALVSYQGKDLPNGIQINRLLRPASFGKITRLQIIVDGSASMKTALPHIAAALTLLPSSLNAEIRLVGDSNRLLTRGFGHGGDREVAGAARALNEAKAEGGQDNSESLIENLSTVAASPNTAVLWIHGPQPLEGNQNKLIAESLARSDRPILFDLQVMAGPDELLKDINNRKSLVRVPRTGDLQKDLRDLFATLASGDAAIPEYTAEAVSPSPTQVTSLDQKPTPRAADRRLGQIWANKQISEYVNSLATSNNNGDAMALAQAFQIISPVSSAVVTKPLDRAHMQPIEKQTIALEMLNPFSILSKIIGGGREVASHYEMPAESPYDSVVNQLNSLCSASSSLGQEESKSKQLVTEKTMDAFGSVSLQGATNGIISPVPEPTGGAQFGAALGTDAAKESEFQSKNLRLEGVPGHSAATGGLVGAPVDPRYGQSNEIDYLADYSARQSFAPKKGRGFLDATPVLALLIVWISATLILFRIASKKKKP